MKNFLHLFLFIAVFAVACSSGSQQGEGGEQADNQETAAREITLTPLEGSPAYPDANLSLISSEMDDAGNYAFNFEVQNYELGTQTEGAGSNGLANSGKGQHIHFIVDNSPYSAHYEPAFSTDKLKEHGNHVVLAFLSRSYHESVKNMGTPAMSYFLDQFQTADANSEQVDLSTAHMFYSRPKGTYSGKDIEKVLLDFFLVNVDLSPDGYKVKATINGEEFTITEWQPYVIEGLSAGEATISLELVDAEGNTVDSPFNPVTRTVTLEADAAGN